LIAPSCCQTLWFVHFWLKRWFFNNIAVILWWPLIEKELLTLLEHGHPCSSPVFCLVRVALSSVFMCSVVPHLVYISSYLFIGSVFVAIYLPPITSRKAGSLFPVPMLLVAEQT
jgi:hypothetical protein